MDSLIEQTPPPPCFAILILYQAVYALQILHTVCQDEQEIKIISMGVQIGMAIRLLYYLLSKFCTRLAQ